MADSGFADTIRDALNDVPRAADVFRGNAEYATPGTSAWVQRVWKLLSEIRPALAGLEAERDEQAEWRGIYMRRLNDAEAANEALAAVLETTREALRQSCGASTRADDPRCVWVRFPLDAWATLAAQRALNLTRPEDASIVPAADQGGQNE